MNQRNLTYRLEQCYTGVVYDAMREQGLRDCILPAAITPLLPERRLAGPAFTVSGKRCDLSGHETLLAWTGMLSVVPEDSVLVIQPNDDEQAYMGELSAETLNFRKVRGAIIDGYTRDAGFIIRLGFRLHCRGMVPRDIVGSWIPEGIGAFVRIGNVDVHTGDYVVADRDGIVVVPQARAQEITERAESFLNTENNVRKAILQGVDPQTAYLNHGKF
jgi:regulator of RNase E activity RraA